MEKGKLINFGRFSLLALLAFTVWAGAAGAVWKLHPSFDNNPLRIIDTAEETFFLVHQQPFEKNNARFNKPSVTIFRYEKGNPGAGIRPLFKGVNLYSPQMKTAAYVEGAATLAIGYEDGTVELVGRGGRTMRFDVLRHSGHPGMMRINSLMSAPGSEQLTVATDGGLMHIDVRRGTPGPAHNSSRLLLGAFDTGRHLVALAGDGIVAGDSGTAPDGLRPVAGTEGASALLPLTGDSFAFVSGTPGGENALIAARFEAGAWKLTELCRDSFTARDDNNTISNRYEGNFIPNRDGCLLYSPTAVWQLTDRGAGALPEVRRMALDADMTVVGSHDFEEFWGYSDRGRFVRRAPATDGSGWKNLCEPIRPEAPAAFTSNHMEWSPKYGMLVMNREPWDGNTGFGRHSPMLLSALGADGWGILSPAYTPPRCIESNAALSEKYRQYRSWFPFPDPSGLTIDPLFPDYIWSGSIWGGLMMTNLGDMGGNHRRFGAENDYLSDFPGFQAIVPDPGWDTFCNITPISVDSEGNLWAGFFDWLGNNAGTNNFSLLCLTAEKRRKMMEKEPAEGEPGESWTVMPLNLTRNHNMYSSILALRHPSRRNMMVAAPYVYDAFLVFVNHGGTPDDPSDDRVEIVDKYRYEDGYKDGVVYINDMTEDPATGDLYLCARNGLVIVRSGAKPENGWIDVEVLKLRNGERVLQMNATVNAAMFDSQGRLWVGSDNGGVVGVSSDFEKVIARYDTQNSPLPSDRVYGLGWNQTAGSLMISTDKGLAEVVPDTPGTAVTPGAVRLEPAKIPPGYNGALRLSGLRHNSRIEIRDREGRVVAELANGNSGSAEWNLKDSTGKRVAGGIYRLTVSDGTQLVLPVL